MKWNKNKKTYNSFVKVWDVCVLFGPHSGSFFFSIWHRSKSFGIWLEYVPCKPIRFDLTFPTYTFCTFINRVLLINMHRCGHMLDDETQSCYSSNMMGSTADCLKKQSEEKDKTQDTEEDQKSVNTEMLWLSHGIDTCLSLKHNRLGPSLKWNQAWV